MGQGFGVGAFEDEDEDIYAKDDISQYDFSLTSDNCKSDETVKSTIKTEEILEGFKLQSKKCIRAVYQLPVIPKNFKGNHQPEISRFHNVEIRSNISEKDKESGKVLEEFM